MNREEKRKLVAELHEAWQQAAAGVVVHYRGLTVAEMSTLRRSLRDVGARLRVVKCTLARRAAEDTPFAALVPLFSGPIAVAYGDEPVGMAKALVEFAKGHEALVILGGVLDGQAMDPEGVKRLAALPSREELLAQLFAQMQAPIAGFVRVLSEVPASFVRALAAIRDQKEAQGA